ncbi:hypothetical protein [Sciscionella sediminilitoris]|uniref:hypothetical protein n=1 Tax=Sciscionella sediminilitoris TaxID=1445613 RepID=UPI0012E15754|nr:hypothetical protein [Sciscionella sp. SE31]
MSEFIRALQSQIDQAQQAWRIAVADGREHDAARHRARVQDLLDLAARHDVDTAGWIDAAPSCWQERS